MFEDEPVLNNLDIDTYQAQLFPHGSLKLTNNTANEEIVLSPQATYDLLNFLHQYMFQIYRAVRKPLEVNYFDEHVTICRPIGDQGEQLQSQEDYARFVYGEERDPFIVFVYWLVVMWVEEAYNGEARVTRIDQVPFDSTQREPDEPESFARLRSWYIPQGVPEQAWRVTIWPSASPTANHIYVHRYRHVLYTGRSKKQSGRPYYFQIENYDSIKTKCP